MIIEHELLIDEQQFFASSPDLMTEEYSDDEIVLEPPDITTRSVDEQGRSSNTLTPVTTTEGVKLGSSGDDRVTLNTLRHSHVFSDQRLHQSYVRNVANQDPNLESWKLHRLQTLDHLSFKVFMILSMSIVMKILNFVRLDLLNVIPLI
jgi:hypothetical protein